MYPLLVLSKETTESLVDKYISKDLKSKIQNMTSEYPTLGESLLPEVASALGLSNISPNTLKKTGGISVNNGDIGFVSSLFLGGKKHKKTRKNKKRRKNNKTKTSRH